jgi:hypothetical protein
VEAAGAASRVGGLAAALGLAGEIAAREVFPTRNLIVELAAAGPSGEDAGRRGV